MPRAVLMTEPGRPLTVEDVDVADPGPGELRVRIAASGVCHSDVHVFESGAATIPKPVVLGHEAAGEILQVGPGTDNFAVGDHVVLCVFPQCGVCTFCMTGYPTLCDAKAKLAGATMMDGTTRLSLNGQPVWQMAGLGTYCEETIVSALSAVVIDPSMPLVSAALLGCGVVTGYGAVTNVGNVGRGDTVAITGCGGLGLNAIQASRIVGADRIIAIDRVAGKLRAAKTLGATDIVDASAGDAVEQVRQLTGGLGVHVALDFVGVAKTAADALAMTRRGGTAVLTGLAEPIMEFSINELVRAGRQIKGNLMGMGWFRDEFPKLVRLYQEGQLKLDELVSKRLDLTEVDLAFAAMSDGDVARSVLVMN